MVCTIICYTAHEELLQAGLAMGGHNDGDCLQIVRLLAEHVPNGLGIHIRLQIHMTCYKGTAASARGWKRWYQG